jgi:DNA-binding PucR family transcriptional regulator
MQHGPAGALDVAALTRRAVADSGGAAADLLDGYLELLSTVAREGRRPERHELAARRALGVAAAERGVALAAVVDLYLSATWIAWKHLPRPPRRDTDAIAAAVLRATNDAIVALAEGYDSAQRQAIRVQEAARREFIDDLLGGSSDLTRLPERSERFGLRVATTHAVAVATAGTAFTDGDERTRRVEAGLAARYGDRDLLVASKEARLVCVAPAGEPDAVRDFARRLHDLLPPDAAGLIGVGRPQPGPAGVAHSYREACDVLDVAALLGLATPILHAEDLLVYQVLLRDRAAITDLVDTVLGPLRRSRGGARPLVETLTAYFEEGNAVAAARRLHLGVRTVTYRLKRVRDLTDHDPTDPAQRFTLETAVLGARLLGWPVAGKPD